ncbi:attractin [Cydia splendana]|uniref:attractin n=1 Tax=Cydia splendana TaxID=1100963 RepID=UPI00300D6652
MTTPYLVPYENYTTGPACFTSALTKLVENAYIKMVESLQMFLFLFKSKYRRKFSWFSPFLCSVLIVLLFCNDALAKCSNHNCINGDCKNETCVCKEGWQGPECQYCGGKINLTDTSGVITDGPGNYSVSTQCTWLVAPPRLGPSPPVVRIRLESFSTECGWDHLYVYDGDSVRAVRLLAIFSGVMEPGESGWTRQVIARSGSALLHFFSDDAFAMEGFNVTYAAYSCPSDDHRTNCSNHGECDEGTCRCNPGWIGVACDQPICPDNCNEAYGGGTCTPKGCVCTPQRSGADCSRDVSTAGWRWLWKEPGEGVDEEAAPAVAGHVLVQRGGEILRVGGESFGQADFLYRYKVAENKWEPIVTLGETPAPRFAHSAVLFDDELIVYGGVVASDDTERGGELAGREGRAGEVTNEVWRLNLAAPMLQWLNATPTICGNRPAPMKHCGGLAVSGHTAVVVRYNDKPVMLVFFGHSPHYGYLHLVQEYHIEEGVWVSAPTVGWAARGGFGHSAVLDPLSDRVYVHGGLVSQSEAAQVLLQYHIEEGVWVSAPTVGWAARGGFGHSAVLDPLSDRVYVHGGLVSQSEAAQVLLQYHIEEGVWVLAPTVGWAARGGFGHSAVLDPLSDRVFVHGGLVSQSEAAQVLLQYHIEEGVWVSAPTVGWAARGGFGHSAVLDPLSDRVFVHGGLVSQSEAAQAPSAALYEYEYKRRIWRPLPSAPTPRYLHSAIILSPGIMLVFGGNAHNDSAAAAVSNPAGSQCYSAGALLYDIRCSSWRTVPTPPGAARAAHAAALLPGALRPTAMFYGGFDGRLRSDALVFEAGSPCSSHTNELACVANAQHACRACAWNSHERICVPLETAGWNQSFDGTMKACVSEPVRDIYRCRSANSCAACTAAKCAWCGSCQPEPQLCSRLWPKMALMVDECASTGELARDACARYHSCAACHAHQQHHHHLSVHSSSEERSCYWDYESIKCKPANSSDDIRSVASAGPCTAPCATFHTCSNCTSEECIWCASTGRCVDKNAYGASFPLGGCRLWSTSSVSGGCGPRAARAGCARHVSCAACRAEPACGWCGDAARPPSGRGLCLPGGARRPHEPHVCETSRWFFTDCPRCQCNGHSTCDEIEGDRCIQPCGARAVGLHCDTCAPGHYGDPLNGGTCKPCECNAQAVACAPDTGRCFCSTKGLAGERCDKCDNSNHYHADLYNKGACYYDLAVDYQFTFNLSKKEDRHLSAINFRNAPVKADVDADFSITCSAHARMNLTVRTRSEPGERTLFAHVNCTNFRYKFAKSDHAFGVEDNVTLTTFFVYVYDFRPPLWIQISFSQYPKLNLQQFFITFSSCFLLLLLVAAALWKIKQKYDLYRRRQRLFVEMEQMASRPFSQVCVELEKGGAGCGVPAPVALEPCLGSRAAVLSLLVRLPTGGTGRAPPLGGLAVASALVTLGHHQDHKARR